MIKMQLYKTRKNRNPKNLFRTDYLLKLTDKEIKKWGKFNKGSITITDKKLSYKMMKENIDLKQEIIFFLFEYR